jgi:hypothetical protein
LRLLRARARLEMAVAWCAGVLGIVTIFWHDWIEVLTGRDPDHHDGSMEWIMVLGLLAIAVTLGLVARGHRRLPAAGPRQIAASGGRGRRPGL